MPNQEQSAKNKEFRCELLPYQREDLLTMQDFHQHVGWEITAFNLPSAWRYTQGQGVKVAVIDSGCDLDHQDLVENLAPGRNFVDPTKTAEDDNGHGTHVTGIICARNTDSGMVGVAPLCNVIPVKALDAKGAGDLRKVADAIVWAVDQGADFLTMSLGSPNPVEVIHDAIKYADKRGVIVFCAAGNAGKTREIFFPAAYEETIGIGAIDENFNRASFSCTGSDLDFLAPGVRILSTVPDNWYAVMSGTSMANPFVVGVAALLLSYKRAHPNRNIKLDTSDDYRNLLKSYAIPTHDPQFAGNKFFEGFGIIDPRKLEEWASRNQ